jgi:hypothetical protein
MMKVSMLVVALFTVSSTLCAAEAPTKYQIMTTATQFNEADNTYAFQVRFISNPCAEVNYNIGFSVTAKDSDEAIAKVQSQIDKIASDVAKDEEKRCHNH